MKTRLPCAALLLLCVLALAWLPSRAQAQFSFTLNPNTVSGAPGSTITFFGTLTNLGKTSLASNFSPSFNLFSGPSGVDLTAFPVALNDVFAPDSLAPGTSAVLPLFSLDLDPAAPFGRYGGNFSISYGGSTKGQDLFVNVATPQAVPEAGTGLTLSLGLLCLTVVFVRRAKAASPAQRQ